MCKKTESEDEPDTTTVEGSTTMEVDFNVIGDCRKELVTAVGVYPDMSASHGFSIE